MPITVRKFSKNFRVAYPDPPRIIFAFLFALKLILTLFNFAKIRLKMSKVAAKKF